MYPIILTIGKINIYSHGLMIAIGALVGGLLTYLLARKRGLSRQILFDTIIYSLLGGIIFARIAYVIIYRDQFEGFTDMLKIWYGGLISFGGLIGGLGVAWLILHLRKENILKWFDLGIIGIMAGWALGRIGCFLNGDSVGITSESKIAIWGHIPTQILESIWVVLVAITLYFALRLKEKRNLPDGIVFWAGIILYALGRFFVDFYREEEKIIWFLKPGQLTSLIVLVLVGVIFWFLYKEKIARYRESALSGKDIK